ncbi:MAG: capsule assembly Wzi family protein [Candidatus Deferrimicrobiaceae bacterium]
MVKSQRFLILLVAVLSLVFAAPASAADLFLNDEPEVYAAIDKLNALGYLPGLLANKRPYSLQAVRAAVRTVSRTTAATSFEGELLRWVNFYVTPKQMGRVTTAVAFSDTRFTPDNSEGIPIPDGWSGRASLGLREETTPLVSGQLRTTYFYGEGGDNGGYLLDASLEVGKRFFAVQAGNISSWYGPGRKGALILTNNARPYPGVRIYNPVPIPLSGWFGFLGNVQYDFFAARMERKELFSHSTFVGTRLAARPAGWLEFGFSRALHYGGDGGDDNFFKYYFGSNDPPESSNTLGGFDVTLTLPFSFQPVQAYMERGAEDSSAVGSIFIPWDDRFANLFGVYFPKVLGISRLDLRAEYADTFYGTNKGDNWYGHPSYPHQYRGEILGHAMGGSARDWFFESRYFFLPAAYADVSFERVLHDSESIRGERRSLFSWGLTGWLTKAWRAEARATVEHVSNQGGVTNADGTSFSAWFSLAYQVDMLYGEDYSEDPRREYRRSVE